MAGHPERLSEALCCDSESHGTAEGPAESKGEAGSLLIAWPGWVVKAIAQASWLPAPGVFGPLRGPCQHSASPVGTALMHMEDTAWELAATVAPCGPKNVCDCHTHYSDVRTALRVSSPWP